MIPREGGGGEAKGANFFFIIIIFYLSILVVIEKSDYMSFFGKGHAVLDLQVNI
jgi:hypothetical protein